MRPSCAAICRRDGRRRHIATFLLLACLSAPATVVSFAHPRPTTPRSSSSALRAAKRGGAMARRKKKQSSDGRGFDRREESADDIYSMPPLYDLAFGYRSYEDEVDFLLDAHRKYARSASDEPLRILELAAGPARHSLAALSEHPPSKVDSVLALDASQAMVDYGVENADHELGAPGGRRDDFHYVKGDMRNVGDSTRSSFDSAWMLLGSTQHLLTNEDVITCFSSIRSVLESGGTVVLELPHPRETFSMGECTRNGWTVPLVEESMDGDAEDEEYGELNIIWGDEDDDFDPIAQVRRFTVEMELTVDDPGDIPNTEVSSTLLSQISKEGKAKVREIVPMRLFTLQEIDALARCAGFELVAKRGALAEDVSIEDEEEAFRMVCVLRTIDD